MWFLLSLLSAFFQASGFAVVKKFSGHINPRLLAGGTALVSSIILFAISLFIGFPEIKPDFYKAVLITTVLNIVATFIYYKALSISDFSVSMPLISFTPIFLVVTSFIILGEVPSVSGTIGIFITIFGSYILNIKTERGSWFDPIKCIFEDKGSRYMLLVAFIYSITSNYDKMVILNSDAIFGSAVTLLLMGAFFVIVFLIKGEAKIKEFKKGFNAIILNGAMSSLSTIFINLALTMQLVAYVSSLKRASVLFGVFYGKYLFKEKNIKARMAGAAVMVLGIIIIALYK